MSLVACILSVTLAVAESTGRPSKLIAISENPLDSHSIQFLDREVAFRWGYQHLWRTTDGAMTWRLMRLPIEIKPADKRGSIIGVRFTARNEGFVSILSGGFHAFETNDGGEHWRELSAKAVPQAFGGDLDLFVRGDQAWVAGSKRLGPQAAKVDRCESASGVQVRGALHYSPDGGRTWREQTLPDDGACSIERIAFHTPTNGIAVGGSAVYYTDDTGTSWHRGKFVDREQDSWGDGDIPPVVLTAFVDENTGWLSYQDGFVFKTTDGGRSWRQQIRRGQLWNPDGFGFFGRLGFASPEVGWMVGGTKYERSLKSMVYETNDGGNRWRKLNTKERSFSDVSCVQGECWVLGEKWLYRLARAQ